MRALPCLLDSAHDPPGTHRFHPCCQILISGLCVSLPRGLDHRVFGRSQWLVDKCPSFPVL